MTAINLIYNTDTTSAQLRDIAARIVDIFEAEQQPGKQSHNDKIKRQFYTTDLTVEEIRDRTKRLDEIPIGVGYTIVF